MQRRSFHSSSDAAVFMREYRNPGQRTGSGTGIYDIHKEIRAASGRLHRK
jgi:hypothetical protein